MTNERVAFGWRRPAVAIGLALLAACAGQDRPGPVPAPAVAPVRGREIPGYSGLAKIDGNRFLVVHDTKSQNEGSRLGILEIGEGARATYTPLAVGTWPEPWGRSNDMEGVCAMPGRPGEFLAVEASFWRGRPRRLLHFEIGARSATVPFAVELPPAGPDDESDGAVYYEGIACAAAGDGRTLVILGQYGGDGPARLRWGSYRDGELRFDDVGREGLAVAVPGEWWGRPRAIGDLHLDGGLLWAAASEDPGDQGPFRSLIYELARVEPTESVPVRLLREPRVAWTVDGFKIEALAAPADLTPGSPLSFGTEDEAYGGVWRPLGPVPEVDD